MIPKVPAIVLRTAAFQPLLDLLDSSYLTAAELADRWRYTDDHLSNLRRAGKGPRFIRLPDNGRVLYPASGVIENELRGETRLSLDVVLLAVSSCASVPVDQRAAIIEHIKTALRTAGEGGSSGG